MFFGTILLFRCVGGQEIVHECVALLFHQRGKALSVASQFFVVEIKVFMRPFPIDLYLSQHHSLRKFEMEEKAERILVLKRLHLAERCTGRRERTEDRASFSTICKLNIVISNFFDLFAITHVRGDLRAKRVGNQLTPETNTEHGHRTDVCADHGQLVGFRDVILIYTHGATEYDECIEFLWIRHRIGFPQLHHVELYASILRIISDVPHLLVTDMLKHENFFHRYFCRIATNSSLRSYSFLNIPNETNAGEKRMMSPFLAFSKAAFTASSVI